MDKGMYIRAKEQLEQWLPVSILLITLLLAITIMLIVCLGQVHVAGAVVEVGDTEVPRFFLPGVAVEDEHDDAIHDEGDDTEGPWQDLLSPLPEGQEIIPIAENITGIT